VASVSIGGSELLAIGVLSLNVSSSDPGGLLPPLLQSGSGGAGSWQRKNGYRCCASGMASMFVEVPANGASQWGQPAVVGRGVRLNRRQRVFGCRSFGSEFQ